MKEEFKKIAHKIIEVYIIEKKSNIMCSETTSVYFHYISGNAILVVENSLKYSSKETTTQVSTQTDYLVATDRDNMDYSIPLSIKELAEILLDSKQSAFSLVRTQNNILPSIMLSCFSETIDKIIIDIESGKIIDKHIVLLPEEDLVSL